MTVATYDHEAHGSALALSTEQDFWNDKQLAALRHMGVENAGNGDLAVFHHVCQRTGLDPFAKQIHMIGRNTKDHRTNQWVTKYTIQTGIDGFRLIARRASDHLGETLEYDDTLWCGTDGEWADVWTKATAPTAAKVVVIRHGKRFPAVALYREYVQTKKDGQPNSMWSGMPANQLAKCAEALALRKAFPQDLSGIYADEEMGQADRPGRREAPSANQGTAAERMGAVLGTTAEHVETTGAHTRVDVPDEDGNPESPMLNTSSVLAKKMFATLGDAGINDRDERLAKVSEILGREVASSTEMTDADAERVIDALEDTLAHPFPGADA